MAPPRTMHWFRWHHNTTNDHVLRRIAAHSHTSVANVVAVWACVLESASESANRGVLGSWDTADVAFVLGIDEEIVVRIYASMQGQVLDGQQVINWYKRNPKREDERPAHSHRTPQNPTDSRTTPPEERRGDKRRREKKLLTTSADAAPAPSAAEGSGKDSTQPEVPTISTNPSFVSLLGDDWKEITGGLPSWGKLGAALEPVVKTYGMERVRPAWRKFCNSTSRKYGPMHFKEHFGDYEPKIVSGLDEAAILEALGIQA